MGENGTQKEVGQKRGKTAPTGLCVLQATKAESNPEGRKGTLSKGQQLAESLFVGEPPVAL